jgi:predicted enzyme related to lactoylglutathione lyase
MTADAALFVPLADGTGATCAAPDHAAVASGSGEHVLARAPGAGAPGRVEEVALAALDERAARAGADIAVVALDDGGRALALRAHEDRWQHTSLAVSDLDRAIAFYGGVLGFEVRFEERGMGAQIASITGLDGIACDIAQLSAPGSRHVLELIAFSGVPPARSGHAPTPPGAAHVSFAVSDLERAIAEIVARGGHVLGAVTQFEDGPSVYCREPAGSFLELDQR